MHKLRASLKTDVRNLLSWSSDQSEWYLDMFQAANGFPSRLYTWQIQHGCLKQSDQQFLKSCQAPFFPDSKSTNINIQHPKPPKTSQNRWGKQQPKSPTKSDTTSREDPFLTSRMAASYVRGVQRFSAACVSLGCHENIRKLTEQFDGFNDGFNIRQIMTNQT